MFQVIYVTLDKICLFTWFFYALFSIPSLLYIVSLTGNMPTPWLWFSYPVFALIMANQVALALKFHWSHLILLTLGLHINWLL